MVKQHASILFLIIMIVSANSFAQGAKAVDTRKLQLIRPGMSQTEVENRLGVPGRIVNLGSVSFYSKRIHAPGFIKREMHIEKWIYPGNYSYPPASIVFENGVVKSRGRE